MSRCAGLDPVDGSWPPPGPVAGSQIVVLGAVVVGAVVVGAVVVAWPAGGGCCPPGAGWYEGGVGALVVVGAWSWAAPRSWSAGRFGAELAQCGRRCLG
jgi:hypothetical protein